MLDPDQIDPDPVVMLSVDDDQAGTAREQQRKHPPLRRTPIAFARLFARLGHYYPWFSDEVALRMPWQRLLMYAREMVIAQEEARDAQEEEMRRARAEMDARSAHAGGTGGNSGAGIVTTGPWDDVYAAAHPHEQGKNDTDSSIHAGADGRSAHNNKPTAWQWDN